MVQNKLKDDYHNQIKQFQPKPQYFQNCLRAFLIGGLICMFGQVIQNFYIDVFHYSKLTAGNPTVATLILISSVLTGFGIYGKIGQFAGAGASIPVTGFANSMTSAALEHRSEGIVLGMTASMFKLVGSVIAYGVLATYLVGMIRYLFSSHYLG